jgi:hypothetical protein
MRKKLAGVMTALPAAVLAVTATASPASATNAAVVSLPGAYGTLTDIDFTSSTRATFEFFVEDTARDGDHAQARVVTLDSGGTMHFWTWHSAIGYHARYSAPNSYAHDTRGIQAITIQVCRAGDSLPDICDMSAWVWNRYV